MHFRTIRRIGDLQRLRPAWLNLPLESPFTSPEWMIRWAESFLERDSAAELFSLSVHDDAEQLIGIVPWYRRRTLAGRRCLQFLGSGLVCSDHLGLIAHRDRQYEIATQLVDFLSTAEMWAQWDTIALEGINADDPAMRAFTDRWQQESFAKVHLRDSLPSYWMALPESWQAFVDSCSKNRRKRLRRWQRVYIDSGRLQRSVVRDPDELPAAFETLVDLHNRRRRDLGESGAFEDSGFLEFHRAVMPELLPSDQLHLSVVRLDDRPVAAEYMLKLGDALLAYQSGLDPAAVQHSPGNLSLMLTIQDAIQQGVRKLDFLRGDEQYKLAWGCERRDAQRIRIRRSDFAGRIEHWADRMKGLPRRIAVPALMEPLRPLLRGR